MAGILPEGLLSGEKFDEFGKLAKAALVHMIEKGETPAFVGKPMTAEEAVTYLRTWLDDNKVTLAEGGLDFLTALAKQIAVGDEEQPIEEFEAGLRSMTDEQLVVLSEMEAAEVERLKRDVIDRRRALLASLLETGRELLRGAVATGLNALMDQVGDSSFFGGGRAVPDSGGAGGDVP